jgi:uncharacterized membrane protein YqjE
MAFSLEAARRAFVHLGHLALARQDLAAEELAMGWRRWAGWMVVALLGLALLVVALGSLTAWLTLVLWERFGAATIGVLALAFGIGAVALMRGLLQVPRGWDPPLARTRQALREDFGALSDALAPARNAERRE